MSGRPVSVDKLNTFNNGRMMGVSGAQTGIQRATLRLVVFLSSFFCADYASCTEQTKPLLVGFVPAFSAERIIGSFEPLLNYVAEKTGVQLRLETAPDIPEFMRRVVKEQRYAITFVPPHLYSNSESAGYSVVAKVAGADLRAVFITGKESPIRVSADLKGKQVAIMDGMALATILGMSKLRQEGFVPRQDVFIVDTPNMDSSTQAVLRGRADAAVVIDVFFRERLAPEVRGQLRVFMESDTAPNMPVSVASWVDPSFRTKLVAVLLDMHNDKDGASLLRRAGWQGFDPAMPSEYLSLGKLVSEARE